MSFESSVFAKRATPADEGDDEKEQVKKALFRMNPIARYGSVTKIIHTHTQSENGTKMLRKM